MPRSNRSLVVVLVALALFTAACGQGNDPETWAEAQEDGNLRDNFMKACSDANVGGEVEFTDSQRSNYCTCAFGRIVEYYGGSIDADNRLSDAAEVIVGRDFEGFKGLEDSLRDEPGQLPADIEKLYGNCRDSALGA